MSETITLQSDGKELDVELEEPSIIDKLRIEYAHPGDFEKDKAITKKQCGFISFLISTVTSAGEETVESINKCDNSEFIYLLESCISMFEETDSELQSREEYFGQDRQNLVNKDGSVNSLYD